MTEDEFKAQAREIFRQPPSTHTKAAVASLILLAQESIPLNKLAVLAGESLDEAIPEASGHMKEIGEKTAAERMQEAVDRRLITNRVTVARTIRITSND